MTYAGIQKPISIDSSCIEGYQPKPIDDTMKATLEQKISKLKSQLMLDYPFWGYIAMNLPFRLATTEEQIAIPTAGVSYTEVIFNPWFIQGLSTDEDIFLGAHELFHPMLEHLDRRQGRDPKLWNVAGDIVINYYLVADGIGKMLANGCYDKELFERCDGNTDKIYDELSKNPERYKKLIGGDGDTPFDIQIEDGQGKSPAEIEQRKQQWKVLIAQALQTAKAAGNVSANMELLVGELLQPKVDWAKVMREFQEKAITDDRSFARLNRRFLSQDLILPAKTGEQLGEVAYAMDMSGSCLDYTTQFMSELNAVCQELKPKRIHIIYFDSEVCGYDVFEQGEEVTYNPKGGGGTAFSPVFKFMEEKDINPVSCVFLTDLECSDFGDAPDYPVLWVSTEKGEAPFGEIVLM